MNSCKSTSSCSTLHLLDVITTWVTHVFVTTSAGTEDSWLLNSRRIRPSMTQTSGRGSSTGHQSLQLRLRKRLWLWRGKSRSLQERKRCIQSGWRFPVISVGLWTLNSSPQVQIVIPLWRCGIWAANYLNCHLLVISQHIYNIVLTGVIPEKDIRDLVENRRQKELKLRLVKITLWIPQTGIRNSHNWIRDV